ncbi:MAPEG family protein [Hellea balneolensis]|uniref:MAPEG family protein n=1 Tax=Hellea balneolensis TaxID=287478 RepID=UPI00040A42D4|nr:MAPEG family protein [Hellea balneolensis]
MAIELKYLVWSVALFFVMILAQAIAATLSKKASLSELVGPRDNMPKDGLTPLHGRTKRAQANFVESMCMFAPLVLVAAVTNSFSDLTALGAALFFWGRVVFAPTYWLGVPWVRTLAWFVSIAGILMILWELLT